MTERKGSDSDALAQQMQALVGASQMAGILRDGEKPGTMARRYTNARLELAGFVGANWPEICATLQRQDERVRELEGALREITELPGELNESNYDHSDVELLNRNFIRTYEIARATLKDTIHE